jgi:hypothetical protein
MGRPAMLLITVLALAGSAYSNTIGDHLSPVQDPRQGKLEAFFQSFGCPTPHHVEEYLGAADSFDIDYRLLPAISVLESTCGIYQRLNNRWGWDSARKGFASFRAGLEYIARQLAQGPYYRGKTLDEKVHMYNPKPEYAVLVKKLMRKIDDRIVVPVQDAAVSPQKSASYRISALPATHAYMK